MKPIKMFSLTALAALMAMAFLGASLAMAEPTTLCSEDITECEPITHVHEESVGHALILSSFTTVECEVLFLGDTEEGAPLIIEGTFTYSCLNGCTVEEENGPAEITVLKTGTELAEVTGEWLVHVKCGLNCRYNGVGLKGHALGALTAANEIGEVTFSGQTLNKESGIFCPTTSKLDISTQPAQGAVVIRGMKHVCLFVGTNNGFYLASNGAGTTCITQHATRIGSYELAWVAPNVGRGVETCAFVGANNGFYRWKLFGICLGKQGTKTGRYEFGVTA